MMTEEDRIQTLDEVTMESAFAIASSWPDQYLSIEYERMYFYRIKCVSIRIMMEQ